ncbi:AzlD domain-containing protein [Rhizobiaceae bacterium BDR2-2]|uniref:AzlD domain-containing protein n=1 Tax=Ectorhizobium quercum TaxID=2965071 RepID=A0AAE3N046_9HYPH|nr:AzlD domain-containing protein [Ectorhizobium quercum]MCX8997616.1 AzlD domain-containing protein [Ectorhizobium quercum]
MSPDLWSYVFILVAGVLATDIWRWLGVLAGNRLREDSEAMLWVRAVATALVAAVIARLVLSPTGTLAEIPVWMRAGAALAGFVCYIVSGQRILAGIAVAVGVITLAFYAA